MSFETHNIPHLSASSLNLWAAEPALWVMERLLGKRTSAGAAAARGKAVEAGVNIGLLDPTLSVETCIAEAEAAFDREMALNPDPRRDEERKKLPGYVRGALAELRQYGVPDTDSYQGKVEIRLDDISVPVIGYVDWVFSQHGLIIDLKTTERLPSEISASHGRQGAVYASAQGNFGMRFAYTKPAPAKGDGRQVQVLEMSGDDIRTHLTALQRIAKSLGRFLSVSRDPQELAGLIVPDYDSFYWSNPTSRALGKETFGF